jgi:nicotinamide-nucleotide amidase
MGADFAVAVTGAGGPGPEEGKPAGTTFIATSSPRGVRIEQHRFEGSPQDVVYTTVLTALSQLRDDVERGLDA